MIVREGEIEDVEVISQIYAHSWKAAYVGLIPQTYLDDLKEDFWVEKFKEWLISGELHVKLVLEGSEVVGAVGYGKTLEGERKGWGELRSFYLLPTYFGKGYGKVLMQEVKKALKEMGCKGIYLWVLEGNERARHFYEKQGFVQTEEKWTGKILDQEIVDVGYILEL